MPQPSLTSFGTMFLARSFVGMGEAAVIAVGRLHACRTRAPDVRSRDRAFGIYMNATMLGSVVALLFGGTLIQSMPPVAGPGPLAKRVRPRRPCRGGDDCS